MSEQISPHHESAAVVARERPELLMFCGAVGLIGNIAPMITIIWAAVVIDHNFIADSISDLARGPHRRIMDVGFYVNAAGLLALAIGTAHAHLGRAGWSLGIFALAFLAMVVTLLDSGTNSARPIPARACRCTPNSAFCSRHFTSWVRC